VSQKRHSGLFDRARDRKSAITTLTRDYPHGHVIPLHFHDRDQIVYASHGVMTIRTESGIWVVPPQRAVWIPAGITHTIRMSGIVAMRTLYLKPQLAKKLPRECCVANVSPLLRELILQACGLGTLRKQSRSAEYLIGVILDQLNMLEKVPLQLPDLSDPRARRAAAVFASNPSDTRTLAQVCKSSGASKRTIERLFLEEVGMTFGKWRQQLRLMHALRLLAEGAKVTHAALEAGYSTPSAFISMFRRSLGTTPIDYFKSTDRTRPHPK
jgi:AraC-like DNA-binding protein/mannose-6-phosphate isomerase-like protein (cupin superfamily)